MDSVKTFLTAKSFKYEGELQISESNLFHSNNADENEELKKVMNLVWSVIWRNFGGTDL